MGIKNLNKYLRGNCPDSIRCIHLSELSGKKIAIDISIYLYKYEAENMLLENIYLLLSILRFYNIIPIFIFDGKAPDEKKALIQKRFQDRADAEKECIRLKETLENISSEKEKKNIMETLDKYKKKIIYMTKEKIDKVKELIHTYGATYIEALGEADEICAMMVVKKKVWACLSEDMDMFVYGCTRVMRYFSLINHTVVLYYTKGILDELEINSQEFREICVLSGTDYNIISNEQNINLFNIIKYFRKYKTLKDISDVKYNFYKWLNKNTDYKIDLELLEKINNMFILNFKKHIMFDSIKITNNVIQLDKLKIIMKPDGFIF